MRDLAPDGVIPVFVGDRTMRWTKEMSSFLRAFRVGRDDGNRPGADPEPPGLRPGRRYLRLVLIAGVAAFALIPVFIGLTMWGLRPVPESLNPSASSGRKVRVVDRNGSPLSITYSTRWNSQDHLPLHEIPITLQRAFITSEDRRFYEHGGVDWPARLHALLQNCRALRSVRGASTITEQVVRMIHPRPRTVWSRWLEGIEAGRLEKRFTKADILEFYLNQVPYAHQRRGVVQAARFYFNRDLDTLNLREMLALAVLVRAPSLLEFERNAQALEKGVVRLASRMVRRGEMDAGECADLMRGGWEIEEAGLPVDAGHFVQYLYQSGLAAARQTDGRLATTIDAALQARIHNILDRRLRDLKDSAVENGAVLVVDHETDEILSWVNGGSLTSGEPGAWIDAVRVVRQPGSTLKPFLYGLALEMGWTPATIIDDSPLAEAIGNGLHSFHNYSRRNYGPLRLREALGNSLNVPAVRTIQFTGVDRFLDRLHELGFQNLALPADHYGNGLALGDGEVSLFELVQAYSVLARKGEFRPLRMTVDADAAAQPSARRRVFTEESATLIADILSDPQARRLEFGDGHLLRFPIQTAVKTGTSSGHRDALALGFSHRHTVGVWMGNLDRRPTNGLTGAAGPALVLRTVFAELNRFGEARPLRLARSLVPVAICRTTGLRAGDHCPVMQEWFPAGGEPMATCVLHGKIYDEGAENGGARNPESVEARLLQPTPGLQLARDPRIPEELEAFAFLLPEHLAPEKVEWLVDGNVAGVTGRNERRFLWPLAGGDHLAQARIWRAGEKEAVTTPVVRFSVRGDP